MCAPRGTSTGAVPAVPSSAAASSRVKTGPTQTSSSPKCASHASRERLAKIAASSSASACLVLVVLAVGELRAAEKLGETAEELGLERADGEVASVGGRVDAVAGETARQESRDGLAAEPVCDEVVRAMRHRHDDARRSSRASAFEQRRQDLRHRAERAGGEVRDLNGREGMRRVRENAGPAEVVDVVTGPRAVARVVAEAGDGAVDRRVRNVGRADPEARRDAGPEAFDDDVCAGAERSRERRVRGEIADDRLAARAKGGVPGAGARAHRVAARRLDADDASAEPHELAARVGAGEVAREVDDERVGQRLHAAGGYLYPRAR